MVTYGFCAGVIATAILAGLAAAYKTTLDQEKRSPFECGFDPSGVARLPFCIKFFLISIIFLVFDVEVTLLLPALFSSAQVLRLISILIGSTMYEWSMGGLD